MLNTIVNTLVNPLTIGASLTVVGAAGRQTRSAPTRRDSIDGLRSRKRKPADARPADHL